VSLGRDSRFYRELQQVIFSHVAESERLGFETLDELLEHKGEEVSKGIEILVSQLAEINREIVALEEKLTSKHRKGLELQLEEKRRELHAHEQGKPLVVARPGDDPGALQESQRVSGEVEANQRTLRELEAEIRDLRSADGRLARKRTAAERLATKLRNLQRQVDASLNEAAADLAEVGLTRDQVVRFEVMTLPIESIRTQVELERAAIAADLDSERADSREAKRVAIAQKIEILQESLTAPQRAYQEYVQKVKDWEAVRDGIVGSPQQPGTIRSLEKALGDLNAVPRELQRRERARQRKALEILREKQRLRRYYEDYYGAVQKFLATHPLATSDAFKVTFTVTMVQSGFSDGFLAKINQRKLGYFAGVEGGAVAVKGLSDAADWNSARSTLRFALSIVERLKGEGAASRGIQDQLVQSETVQGLYDFLFAFGYLSPIYRLTWEGKGLEQLSPGERGNLLLIFYLLVDRDDIPLVIDQPEENLDNQTVVRTLVPCIKDAKRRRQIVMVTHNPNLAVVCDAEQVIYAEIRKERGNEVTYIGGSIEDPAMNQKIIDVLEGTRPAFDQRDARYQP
jgi:AAA domain, putative AbiEii toxin, Type IV TA system